MESHSRGLRLRTARPIRFPGTPSPKGTSFRDESVENSTAGIRQDIHAGVLYRIRSTFPERRQTGLRTRSAWRAGHIRVLPVATGIRDAFVIAGPVPFSPAKRSGETRFAMASGPQGTKCRHASSPFNRISIRCVRKIADPQAPRTQETEDLRTRNFRREPESVPDPRPTERPAERPGAVGLGSKSGKRSFRTVRHQCGVIAFGK